MRLTVLGTGYRGGACMALPRVVTGSHIPKRLGCYEQELHRLVESWSGYDRVLNVGCGEGWYAVGWRGACRTRRCGA